VCALLLLAIIVNGQEPTERIDFTLEYTGTVSGESMNFTLKSQSEEIRTLINPQGDIHYEIINQFFGPVSHLNGTFSWVDMGKTFKGAFFLSFGASHILQPHVLQLTSIDMGYVLRSNQEIMHTIGIFNVTYGQGAFAGANGGATLIGYNFADGQATWLVTGMFWIIPTAEKLW
jgi:hypothetical protein